MTRRSFVQTTTMIGMASMLSCKEALNNTPRYKLGYQLFSVNDDMNKDPMGTLRALKSMGYQDFEIYGFDAAQSSYYNIPSGEMKRRLEDLNLTVTSGHYGFAPYLDRSEEDLLRFTDQCIAGAYDLNAPYITWPWIAPEQRTIDNFKKMAQRLNIIGERITKAGLGFAYHNHGFEFEDHNGENGYDIILKDTDADLVKLQMDMYWVMHSAKATPAELIKAHPGRYVMWHIKDMDKATRDYTELGNGSIDYVEIMPDPVESGLEYYYLEQGGNFAQNAMQSASDSADYFKTNLQKYL